MPNELPESYPTHRHLRRASRNLTPVVLDFGPDQPRFESYLVGVSGRGAAARALLSPIAADRLPLGRRVTVRSRDANEPLAIEGATVVPKGATSAQLPLAGTALRRMDRRRNARCADRQAPLTLVVPSGTETGDVHVFPIVDLGGDFCSVEATHPLPQGEAMEPVELVGDRRTLRRARAVAQETIPWIDARGRCRYHCRILLGETLGGERPTRDVVGDPRRIRTVLELGAMAGVRVSGRLPDGGAVCGTLDAVRDAALELSLDPPFDQLATPTRLLASFELFGVAYEMQVRVLSLRGSRGRTALPLTLRRMRIRAERRVSCPPGEVHLSFRSPLSAEVCRRELIDVSFGGLSFRPDRADVYWREIPLEDCRLEWRGLTCDLGELRVKAHTDDRVHAGVALAPPTESHLLIDLLATLGHPALRVDRGDDFRGILDAYRRSGIFHGYMTRNLEPIGPQAAQAWRTIRSDGPELTRTLVHEEGGEIDATISVLRSWDNAWIVQHFGATSADGFRWSGELQMASLDYLIPRPNGRYVFFFVEKSNRSMNAFYERFFKLTGTSEAIERSAVQLWSLPAAAEGTLAPRPQGWGRRPLRRQDEPLVARAAERVLGPMTSAALSLVPGEMRLPALGRDYRRIGLQRGRELEMLTHRKRPSHLLFHERCSPGLNLTGKLNASWLFSVSGGEESWSSALRAAIGRVCERPPAAPGLDRFLILPDEVDVEPLEQGGWEHQMTVNTYVLNRAGLVRYYDYIADRYGAADLRAARRAITAGTRTRTQGVAS